MSIAVEDWDELEEPRRRREKRQRGEATAATPAAPAAGAEKPTPAAPAQVARITAPRAPGKAAGLRSRVQAGEPEPPRTAEAEAAPEPEPERVLGVAAFAEDDYGDTMQNLRVPAGIAGANLLVWLVGLGADVVELVGIAFFVSVGLLLAAYMLREWQRDRTALICLAGSLPLPITIISFFT